MTNESNVAHDYIDAILFCKNLSDIKRVGVYDFIIFSTLRCVVGFLPAWVDTAARAVETSRESRYGVAFPEVLAPSSHRAVVNKLMRSFIAKIWFLLVLSSAGVYIKTQIIKFDIYKSIYLFYSETL